VLLSDGEDTSSLVSFDDVLDLAKLDQSHRGLIAGHAKVETSFFVTKARLRERKVAQQTQTFRKVLVVGSDHSAFAGRDHLVRIKTEACHVAETAGHAVATRRAVRLSTVFDHKQVVSLRNLH